jgi:hypothetical protein
MSTAINSKCAKCGKDIGDNSLYIGGNLYHPQCSPYTADPDRSSAEPENQAEALDEKAFHAAVDALASEGYTAGVQKYAEIAIRAYIVPVGVTDALIEKALHARVPGGSEVWHWLPQLDGWTPHETARDIIRCALEAALQSSPPVKTAAVDEEVRKAAQALMDWDDATLNDFIPTNLSKRMRAALSKTNEERRA